MTTPFKTDAGVFRAVLRTAKMPGYNTQRVYNDLNKKTNIRRLKIEHPSYHDKKPTKRQLEDLENSFKAEFGGRFKSLKHLPGVQGYWGIVGAGLAVYLDDNVAPAPKRPPSPRAAVFEGMRRGLTDKRHFEFWRGVLKLKSVRGKTPELTQDNLWRGVIATVMEDITVYKKIYTKGNPKHLIAKMVIPAGTRVRASYGKCRAAKAVVEGIYSRATGAECTEGWSGYTLFKYEVGKTVKPQSAFADWNEECASGIHFFIDLNRAMSY